MSTLKRRKKLPKPNYRFLRALKSLISPRSYLSYTPSTMLKTIYQQIMEDKKETGGEKERVADSDSKTHFNLRNCNIYIVSKIWGQ